MTDNEVVPDITPPSHKDFESVKPEGWARRSTATYYKPIYGMQMKREADKMLANRQDLTYKYSVWCVGKMSLSEKTLYTRINQSVRYLCEKLDDKTATYKRWKCMTDINIIPDVGVRISFKPEFRDSDISDFSGTVSESRDVAPRWKVDMDSWLDDNDNEKPFIIDGLMLSKDEVKNIKIALAGLSNVQAVVTSEKIQIIKL